MSDLIDAAGIEIVRFRVGQCQVGFEARFVRSAQHCGVADPSGTAAEFVLDLPSPEPCLAFRQRLLLKLPDRDQELLVSGPVDVARIAIGDIHPLPSLLAARNYLAGLRALVHLPDKEILLLFDVAALRFS